MHPLVVIFQDNRVVFQNAEAQEWLREFGNFSAVTVWDEFVNRIDIVDQNRVEQSYSIIHKKDFPSYIENVTIMVAGGSVNRYDISLSAIQFDCQPAYQLLLIDRSNKDNFNANLEQNGLRLNALREIQNAMIAKDAEHEVGRVAIENIFDLIPTCQLSFAYLFDIDSLEAELLVFKSKVKKYKVSTHYSLDGKDRFLDSLTRNLKYYCQIPPQPEEKGQIDFIASWNQSGNYLAVPLMWGKSLLGMLGVVFETSNLQLDENYQILEEIASSLSMGIFHSQLRKAEERGRKEAEVMRDMMVALAGAGDLTQTLEIILVNLHNIIDYDRAGLYLVEESKKFILIDRSGQGPEHAQTGYPSEEPLVLEMGRTKKPVVIPDVREDSRLLSWPDLQSVRGWLGAPLLVGEEMIGFLSLGSMRANAYNQQDWELMQVFASQVAEFLEKAWIAERSKRRAEELEVLSNISLALRQAESEENTLLAIVEQLAGFFGASRGYFLLPNQTNSILVVRVSIDGLMIGEHLDFSDNIIWNSYLNQQNALILDLPAGIKGETSEFVQKMFVNSHSGVLIPVRPGGSTGLLVFSSEVRGRFSLRNLQMYNTVAEIAGASIRRAVQLENLERQVNIRTQHLSTLYDINTITSEPIELQLMLERVLMITLDSMHSQIAAIHFLDEKAKELYLVVHNNLPEEIAAEISIISLSDEFWSSVIYSSNPRVVPDLNRESGIPASTGKAIYSVTPAYLGAPIRAKGQSIGLLSLFGETIQELTIEEITLFMAIADQIGNSVERNRLVKKAELAAVVQERQRLSRELHDSVTQLLYSQVLFSGAGQKVLRQDNLTMTNEYLDRIEQAARQALKEMRLLVYQLGPSDYLDEGLVGAIERRFRSVERRTGIIASVDMDITIKMDENLELALYRIAEEALNNIIKHAMASSVNVKIYQTESNSINLEIEDNGRGFDLSQARSSGGMGLANMQDRVKSIGGKLDIISSPGHGSRIIVSTKVPK